MSTTGEWTHEMYYIHTMEYYSDLKRNGILMQAITRKNLEDIKLSEISQTQRDKCGMIPHTGGS